MKEEGENFGSVWASGVNRETYNQMLLNLEEVVRKNIELASNPKNEGDIRCFQSVFIDTGSRNTINQNFSQKKNKGGLQ